MDRRILTFSCIPDTDVQRVIISGQIWIIDRYSYSRPNVDNRLAVNQLCTTKTKCCLKFGRVFIDYLMTFQSSSQLNSERFTVEKLLLMQQVYRLSKSFVL